MIMKKKIMNYKKIYNFIWEKYNQKIILGMKHRNRYKEGLAKIYQLFQEEAVYLLKILFNKLFKKIWQITKKNNKMELIMRLN